MRTCLVMFPPKPERHTFPLPVEVPLLIFAGGLAAARPTPEAAFHAHRRLVDIHPLNDKNGRAARLLMKLVLIRGGYPPVAVRPQDRLEYIHSPQEGQAGKGVQ